MKKHIHIFKKTSWDFLSGIPYDQYIKLKSLRADPYKCDCGLLKIIEKENPYYYNYDTFTPLLLIFSGAAFIIAIVLLLYWVGYYEGVTTCIAAIYR